MVIRVEGLNGDDWLVLQSPFAGVDSGAAMSAVRYVEDPKHWGYAVAQFGDALVLRWSGFIGGATLFQLMSVIDGLAGRADELENALQSGRGLL